MFPVAEFSMLISGLFALFIASFLASTILPGGVEVLLYYMYQAEEYSWHSLLIVATLGNALGGWVTFEMGGLLGTGLSKFKWYRKFQNAFNLSDKALVRVKRYGIPVLFFSWMPIIGDPLCIAGGYLKLSRWPSVAMILVGKFARYVILLWIYAQPWATIPS